MRRVAVLAILLLAGCARHETRVDFSHGPDLVLKEELVQSLFALTEGPDRTLVAWKTLSNADTTGRFSQWRGRTQVASFDHSGRAWSSITTVDSLDGEAPLLVNALDGVHLVMTRSLRTFRREPSGLWAEGPGLSMPRPGLVEALAITAVPGGHIGLAWDLTVPDSTGRRPAEIWYEECDPRFHPIRSERVIAGIRPTPSPGVAIGVRNDGRVWIVSGMDGGSDGIRTHLREGDATWKELTSGTRPWSAEPEARVSDLATTSDGRTILSAAAMHSLKLLGVPTKGPWRFHDIDAGDLLEPTNPSARPLALACFSEAVGMSWIELRDPTFAEGTAPGGLIPRSSMYFDVRGISNHAVAGRDSLVAEDVSALAMTASANECRLWYGTGMLEHPCRIGLKTAVLR